MGNSYRERHCYVCSRHINSDMGDTSHTLACEHSVCDNCMDNIRRGNENFEEPVCQKCKEKQPQKNFFTNDENIVHSSDEKEEKKTMEVCKRHARPIPITLFCNSPGCQKKICQLCMLDDHRKHELLDLHNLQEERQRILLENTGASKKEIQSNKEMLLDAKDEAKKNRETCRKNIEDKADALLEKITRIVTNKRDQLLKYVTDVKTQEIEKIEEDVDHFDKCINKLKKIEETLSGEAKSLEAITSQSELFDAVVSQMRCKSGSRSCKNFNYIERKITTEEVENLCGEINKKEEELGCSRPSSPIYLCRLRV